VARDALMWRTIWWHTYYLYLPEPMKSGRYTVSVRSINPPFKRQATLDYNDRNTSSKVIKVNQLAYSSRSTRRYAYLGWWAGDAGKIDYAALRTFEVIDEARNRTVHTGHIALRGIDDPMSGEDVYEMDISKLPQGRYHIYIPGLARSDTFTIGGEGLRDLYYHTMRAFFHQRCGQEFRAPWTTFSKPACHVEVAKSGRLVTGPGCIHCLWKNVEPYVVGPNEPVKHFRGGYHDAADFDTFAYHLPATAQTLEAYEMYSSAFTDGDLNIPESGNNKPDVLDEAAWGLLFLIENQNPDGSVPLGRGNECDAFKQNTNGQYPPFGVLPPWRDSTATFAAVAAQFARLIKPYDPQSAQRHVAAARSAYEWSKTNIDRPGDPKKDIPSRKARLSWAACELFAATEEATYNQDIKDLYNDKDRGVQYWWARPLRWWAYLTCNHPEVDEQICAWMRTQIIADADKVLEKMETVAYRHGAGPRTGGWGSMLPALQAQSLLPAYSLTHDQEYLDAASLHADFQLGCNPLSKTFITGMGYRHPNRPEIAWYLYEDPDLSGPTVKGLTMYTLGPPIKSWYPITPPWRSHRDLWGNGAEIWSEFTVHQTIGPTAMLFESLYALEDR